MFYHIFFERSVADDGRYALTLAPAEVRSLISTKLRTMALIEFPRLFAWSAILVNYEAQQYEISACFFSLRPSDELEALFRRALDEGLGGQLRFRAQPIDFTKTIGNN